MAVAMRYGSNEFTRSGGASGGGSGGGITMSLLWTNSSPTSSFAAQTVSLDLSGYDAIGIILMFQTTTQYAVPMQILGMDVSIGTLRISSNTNNRTGGRDVTISSTGLAFGAASYNGSSNNTYAIPYKIYGIKGIT